MIGGAFEKDAKDCRRYFFAKYISFIAIDSLTLLRLIKKRSVIGQRIKRHATAYQRIPDFSLCKSLLRFHNFYEYLLTIASNYGNI